MAEIDPIPDFDVMPDVVPADIFEEPESEVPAAPLPYHSDFRIQKHTWYGTDGSVWNLDDPDSGVFLVQEAIEGLHMPLTDEINRISPSIAGSSFQGYRVTARDVVWAVYVYSDDSSEKFYDLDGRFWDSMKIGQYGTWRVTLPDGSFRELSMRQVPVSYSFERDPGRFGWVKYPVRFIADENPFWTYPLEIPGSKVTFASEPGVDFFGGDTGYGPQFEISPTRSETNREIYNDGDEDVYPIIKVNGPMDFVDFSIGEREYHLECDLNEGEWLKIDTRPNHFALTDHTGANRIASVDNWIFDSFPSKETTNITVFAQGLGGGSVVFDVSPLYHRAWGRNR